MIFVAFNKGIKCLSLYIYSDHKRSLLELKETQHQLTTALCPGKDKGMVFKNIMAHW